MNLPLIIVAILLTVTACAARVVPPWLHLTPLLNFAPLMAIAFCGGLYLPRVLAWLVPLTALLISDVLLNWYYQAPLLSWAMLGSYTCYALAIALGMFLARDRRGSLILAGVVVNSALFYLVTNTLAWLTNPVYAPGFSGWIQALTVGDPHFAPTWTFFRQSILSDLLYTGLFVGCLSLAQQKITFQSSPVHRTSTPAA